MDPDVAVLTGLAAAALGPVGLERAGAAVLESLCSLVPVPAATLTAFDPVAGSHAVVGAVGYPASVLAFLRSPAFLRDDVGYRLLVRDPRVRARCWRDIPIDYARTPSATDVFRPAGYAGGASVRLTTSDGRYTGDLHLSTDDPALPSPATLAALHHVAPVLAALTDPARRLSALVPPGSPAAVVVDDGVRALPEHVVPVALGTAEVLVAVLRWRAGRDTTANGSFLAGHERVRLVAVAGGTLVIGLPGPAAYDLTGRELEVLTLLSEGLLNTSIARRLGISERTVAHHVEHVLGKLGVTSRTAATRVAVEEGLRLLPRGVTIAARPRATRSPGGSR